jgi:hypothetical protein
MKLLGDPFRARRNRAVEVPIGTVFLRTPGLVTLPGIHATQRLAWIKELNRERLAAGKPKLTQTEVDTEMAQSVDLLFDDQFV